MTEERKAFRLSDLAEQGALALRRQVNDLFALLDLPTRWRGREPKEIAGNFIEVITELLRLDLALIRIRDPDGVLEHRFPSDLTGEAVLSAVGDARGPDPVTFDLPRPNTVGRTTVRVVAVSPLGEQGTVLAGSWRQNFPTPHELLLLRTAANQAALAMQSSREVRTQRKLAEERLQLERVNSTLARLHAISDGLSRAHTFEQVAEVILTEGLAAVGAQAGSMYLVDDTQSELHLLRAVNLPAPLPRGAQRIPVGADLPIAEAFRDRRGVYRHPSERLAPERYRLPHTKAAAVAALPLWADDQCLGVLGFTFLEPRAFGDDERAFLQAIAQQAAQACDRARLLEAERLARTEAEARQQRADLLSEASAIFGSSLDFADVLTRVAHLLVPRFADWAVMQVSDHTSSNLEQTRTVAVHRDPTQVALAREYSRGLLAARGELRACVTNNSVIAPISVRGQTLGMIILGTAEAGQYDSETLIMAEELGLRAGAALENIQLYEAAHAADRRKNEFLAMLGHELRNPLSPILTALQLMRLKDPHVFTRERTTIERQVEHMVRLVDDLLDVSRITRGKIQLKRERIGIASVLTKALEMTAPLLEQRSHRLEFEPPPDSLVVDGDEARLSQVMANLLNNAAKYTDPGGRIRVSAAGEGDQVVLRVRDSGTGIAPEILPRIFEMFVQDRQSIDRSLGGLGLGLAIVRSLVELHGGTVSVHSEGLGRGSEFVVRLPLARGLSAQAHGAARQPGSALPSPTSAPRAPRLLIVDDNRDAADMLAEALGTVGYNIRIAYDGPTGLEAAIAFCPDIALLDIGLPVMDGYELATRIRARTSLRDIQLVALTGYGQDSDRRRAQEAGFDLHLVKPVDLDHLMKTLQTLTDQVMRGALSERARPG